jgi:hypothetical protein
MTAFLFTLVFAQRPPASPVPRATHVLSNYPSLLPIITLTSKLPSANTHCSPLYPRTLECAFPPYFLLTFLLPQRQVYPMRRLAISLSYHITSDMLLGRAPTHRGARRRRLQFAGPLTIVPICPLYILSHVPLSFLAFSRCVI